MTAPDYGVRLQHHHAQMLHDSGITRELAHAHDIRTVDTKKRLEQLGITKAGRNVPGVLFSMRDK
jgi:hypothetical protein